MTVIWTSHLFLFTVHLSKCIRCHMSKNVFNMVFRITRMLPSVFNPLRGHICQDEHSMWIGTLCGGGCQKEEVVTYIFPVPLNLNSTAVSSYISQMRERVGLSAWLSTSSASPTQNIAFDSTLIYPSLPIKQCIWSVLCLYLLLLKVLNRPQIQFHLTLKSAHSHLFSLFPFFIATTQFQTPSHKLLSNKYNAKHLDPISRFIHFT